MPLKISNLFIFCLLCALIFSCTDKSCEAFDIKRLPFEATYFNQNLKYTNGVDTLKLFPKIMSYSQKTVLDPISYPECNPIFEIEYADKVNVLNILYSFGYYPKGKDTCTHFGIIINSSNLQINLDSIREKRYLNKEMTFDQFHHLNRKDLSQMIRRISFLNMRITEIETHTGIKWKLIK